jgi:hypothetical protein
MKKKEQLLTDQKIMELIKILDDIIEDHIYDGIHEISVASVMLAVAVRKIKDQIPEEEFRVLLEELVLAESGYELVINDDDTERTIH